ncbi:HSP20-like chaperone [Cladorrhinum sp. PSN259]|nr:HSP20-like chaperone [Cladorrhinum sp. PSN259]
MAKPLDNRIYGADGSFTPLFRLLSDWDAYTQQVNKSDYGPVHARRIPRSFIPKFDLREVENAYELHGDLPGISKENINIEFPDHHTVVVRGHVEQNYTSSSPSAGAIENGKAPDAITEHGSDSHKVTVEDEKPEGESSPAVAKKDSKGGNAVATQKQQPRERWLIQERSVGQFSRAFTIPSPIDHDSVSAKFADGVLTIILPKAKKPQPRRIVIN